MGVVLNKDKKGKRKNKQPERISESRKDIFLHPEKAQAFLLYIINTHIYI